MPTLPPQSGKRLLAIECATMCGSVAMISGGHCLAEYSLDVPGTHSQRLLKQLERIREDVGVEWRELDGLAVSLGPGSFTGLRIGLSVAKGLALGIGLPLLGVSTLDGLAHQVVAPPGTKVCALLDARKQEVYAAHYVCGEDGRPVRAGADQVLRPELLAENLAGPVLLVGDGTVTYRETFRARLGAAAIFAPPGSHFPRAATIGLLGEEKLARGELLDPVSSVPIYIRASEAEINLRKK
ncbi:MAG TPA: tRNA (adenosine(37)-N6)-threonylcarbamoyltransferase complex dimerization subunit type 1 TsaB [Desulfurivibrionaceae bacterium]|nr:tRNA (adenosine(37)-N6)-threonylcarbamoyltransferase complex dimerization subunit type 1 TsaB [Desulfurivibrionaceae bacterium]